MPRSRNEWRRPVAANGLGQSSALALDNITAIMARSTLLEETRQVTETLLALVRAGQGAGKQVHDANIVATMLGHNVHKLVTDNVGHFQMFADIELIDLQTI
jgi:predicted nucleic acid-binding protein